MTFTVTLRQLWQRWSGRPPLSLVYSPRYRHAIPGIPLDPGRGEKVLAALETLDLLQRARLLEPQPATLRDLLRVHPVPYLRSLRTAEALSRVAGTPVGAREAAVAFGLARLAVGGTILAVREALASGIALHLGGGLHHAHAAAGHGFCLVNDVAIAVAGLRARDFTGRVLVVDLDAHDGDGTRSLFARDTSVHTYSLHGEDWGGPPAAESTAIALGHGVDDARYLATLRATLPPLLAQFQPALVVYLAGGDVAQGDVLGDWQLSADAVFARDQLVIEEARRLPRPPAVAVLLAGGYGPHAWRFPARLAAWLIAGHDAPLPDENALTLHMVHQRLAALRPPAPEAPLLTSADLPGLGTWLPPPRLLLDVFSEHDLELLLEASGFLEQIRARGFDRLRVELSPEEADTFRVVNDAPDGGLLVEATLRRSAAVSDCELLAVEWLLLQDPRRPFTPTRPRLPGQERPGLGVLREAAGVLALLAEELHLDGLMFHASHWYLAVQGRRFVHCLEPADEARFRAISEAAAGLTLAEAEAALAESRLRGPSGAPLAWHPGPMVLPLSERLRVRVTGPDYEDAVTRAAAAL